MERSALDEAVTRVGDRWALLVVHALLGGARRFGDLAELIPGIASNVLSQRLKRLEAGGVVVAEPYQERPLRYEYRLTAAGVELAGALRLLEDWGARLAGGEPRRHEACGTPMDARWYCPTCARPVDDDETSDLRFM